MGDVTVSLSTRKPAPFVERFPSNSVVSTLTKDSQVLILPAVVTTWDRSGS